MKSQTTPHLFIVYYCYLTLRGLRGKDKQTIPDRGPYVVLALHPHTFVLSCQEIMDPSLSRSAQSSEVATLIDALKEALSADDPTAPATRQHLKETAENLSLALETPGETALRIAYYVSSFSKPAFLNRQLQSPA